MMKDLALSINLSPSPILIFHSSRNTYHLLMVIANGITSEARLYKDTSKWKSPKAAWTERCLRG